MSFTSEKGEMAVPHRLLIVGAGLTGSVSAALLRKKFAKQLLDITFWEKSRGAGGRMNTNRFPSDSNGLSSVDLGAQYISATSDYYSKSHDRYVQIPSELNSTNIQYNGTMRTLPYLACPAALHNTKIKKAKVI